MQIKRTVLIFLTSIFALSGCSKPPISLNGRLVFAPETAKVYMRDLKESSRKLIYDNSEKAIEIMSMSKLNDNLILVEEMFHTHEYIIKKLDLKTGEATDLVEGRSPTVISSTGDFLYIKTGKDKYWYLNKSNINDLSQSKEIFWLPSPLIFLSPKIIEIEDSVFVFNGIGSMLWKLDLNTQQAAPIKGITGCLPQFMRTKSRELFCIDPDTKEKYLIDLKTSRKRVLEKLFANYGFVYVAEKDSVLVGEADLDKGINFSTLLYSFEKDTKEKLNDASLDVGLWLANEDNAE